MIYLDGIARVLREDWITLLRYVRKEAERLELAYTRLVDKDYEPIDFTWIDAEIEANNPTINTKRYINGSYVGFAIDSSGFIQWQTIDPLAFFTEVTVVVIERPLLFYDRTTGEFYTFAEDDGVIKGNVSQPERPKPAAASTLTALIEHRKHLID